MRPLPAWSLTDAAVLPFIAIPAALAALFTWAVYLAWQRAGQASTAGRAAAIAGAATAAWMAVTWAIAAAGVFLDFNRTPPPFAVLVLSIFTIAGGIAFSTVGTRIAAGIPLWVLVGVQGFRFPLELAMHGMAERGIMPEVMSYTGRNADILTGISALVVAGLIRAGRGGPRLAAVWNAIGLALLANIIVVAILATPRFQYFGPGEVNVWVMHPPFVWLPAVMVLAALAGHLIVLRALRRPTL